jgi:hypothetical protein
MSGTGTLEKVKDRQGILSKIENVFGFGYATNEDLRELDMQLRDNYYSEFKTLRHTWEEIYLSALNAGLNAAGDDFKKVIQIIDRVGEKVNRADYGYAGLFDRKGHIREGELTRVFDYDKSLDSDIQGIITAVDDLYKDSEANTWTDSPNKVRNIKSLMLSFESKWDGRENQFRLMEA